MSFLAGVTRQLAARRLLASPSLAVPVRFGMGERRSLSVALMGGFRALSLKSVQSTTTVWVKGKVQHWRDFLDKNPMVKLSLIGAGVFLSVLLVVDWLVRSSRKAGPQPVILLPASAGGYVEHREDDVRKLRNKCKSFRRGLNVVHLCGPESCGKTQLLLQFANGWLEKRTQGIGRWLNPKAPVVICLDARDSIQLLVQLHSAVHTLGCSVNDVMLDTEEQFSSLSVEEQVQRLCQALGSKLKSRRGWLMMLDGEASDVIRKYLPEAGSRDWGTGTAVISGQKKEDWPNAVLLDKGLPMEQCKSLLRGTVHHDSLDISLSSKSNKDESVEQLCNLLECRPLAVAMAGSLIHLRQLHGEKDFSSAACHKLITSCHNNGQDVTSVVAELLVTEVANQGQFAMRGSVQDVVMVREVLGALGWLSAVNGIVPVAVLRQHLQHEDFSWHRLSQQQLLLQQQDVKQLSQESESISSSSWSDWYNKAKAALPFGLGASSSPPVPTDMSPPTASQPAGAPVTKQPTVVEGGLDVTDSVIETLQRFHLVRRREISDCSVLEVPLCVSTASRHDYIHNAAQRNEHEHLRQEQAVAHRSSAWLSKVQPFDEERSRQRYRQALLQRLSRNKIAKDTNAKKAAQEVSSETLHLELHRNRLLAAINSNVMSLQDILAARVFLRLILPIFDALYGGNHGDTNWWPGASSVSDGEKAVTKFLHATFMSRSYGDHKLSKSLLVEGLALFQQVYGHRAACTLQCMNRLASECYKLGELTEARKWLDMAVNVENTISPLTVSADQGVATANTLNHLSKVSAGQNRFSESRELLERSLVLQQPLLNSPEGFRHVPLYADTLLDLAELILDSEGCVLSSKMLNLSLTLHRSVNGDNHPQVYRALTLLGVAHLLSGDETKSKESQKQLMSVKTHVEMAALL